MLCNIVLAARLIFCIGILLFVEASSAREVTSLLANDPPQHTYPKCEGRSLIISPQVGMGLHNQVDLLAHAIYLGIVTNRNVCSHGFLASFKDASFLNIGWIFNLHHINYLFSK